MKVVFDTNIFISALLFPGSIPSEILQAIKKSNHELAVNRHILSEIRITLIVKFKISESYAKLITDQIEKVAVSYDRSGKTLKIIKRDDSDNRILECAVAAKADYLVTGDKKHILPLRKIKQTKIVSAKEFIEILIKERGSGNGRK